MKSIEELEDKALKQILKRFKGARDEDVAGLAQAYKDMSNTILGRMNLNEMLKVVTTSKSN